MIRTIIVDDESRNIKLLAKLVEDHCLSLSLAGTADGLQEAMTLIEKEKPALVLLDIEFPQGTAFSMLEQLQYRDFYIIFITAHNNYAAEAFREKAIDYLLKPVTAEALVHAVNRVEEKIRLHIKVDISKLAGMMEQGVAQLGKIPLSSADGVLFVDETSIMRCEASGRYTFIYLDTGKKITVTRSLKEMESMLQPPQFYRVHHSHIINLRKIIKYHRSGAMEMTDGVMVDVSISRREGLLSLLMNRQGQ